MKYELNWTLTNYYTCEVEANSEEEAREMFLEGGLEDVYFNGDAGDAELTFIRKIG